ncbi:hypothetical protein BGX29_002567, partial [Mortierella sp. GBA35]
MARQVIRTFVNDSLKHAAAVAEVVQLAPVADKESSRSLLGTLVDTVKYSALLDLQSMEGLAKVIQGAPKGPIDWNDLVAILQVLHERLQTIHTPSASHRCRLLLAISRVLDAMADAHVEDVNRITLHEPLTVLLHESESSEDPCVAFQAAYARQALLKVPDNENIWQAGLRRGWLVLRGAAGFAKMPTPTEVKDALEGMEKLYEAGKGGVRIAKDVLDAVKAGETLSFTVKEGLKVKRAWYQALRAAETYIRTGKLMEFNELVVNAPCRHQLQFQMGICQLLGQFAADTHWDLESRRSAVAFLEVLYRFDDIWIRQKGVDQAILDVLTIVVFNHGTHFEAAKILQEEMEQQNKTLKKLKDPQSHPWNDILPADLTVYATPEVSLLTLVQKKNKQDANMEDLSAHFEQMKAGMKQFLPTQSSLEEIQSALKAHYAPDLFIRRVSGVELDLKTCFVNLAIVEAPAQREKEKQDLKEQAAVFHRIPSFEAVERTNIQSSIPLEQLFNKRKLRNGEEDVPKCILVQGRAGIGKTTLCKKLVHAHQDGLWRDLFDTVLWLPLRQLRGSTSRTVESLLSEKIFITQQHNQKQEELARTLAVRAEEGKVLFILDGLDEIATDAQGEGNSLIPFLRTFLGQQHVVITSRPSGLNRLLLPPIDLELETIGFSQQNVKDFVVKVLKPEPARTVQDFIQQTPLIQGLVNIPVQLDVICLCWKSLPKDGSRITITGLYRMMVRKLWCKDALRLKKIAGEQVLTEEEINDLTSEEIDELMIVELHHLGYLAFKGMVNNYQIEFDHQTLLRAFGDLKEYRTKLKNSRLPPQLLEMMKKTSFLHAADADLDPNKKSSQQTWSFLHLTFQEYFAATWIAIKLMTTGEDGQYLSAGSMKIEPTVRFVQEHKYNPRFEIVWWMVAGLLEGEALKEFFRLLQGAPRDLIGGRHQQILASCLDEARGRLDSTVVAGFDAELIKWAAFEIHIYHGKDDKSLLGSRTSFPDALLIEKLGPRSSWRSALAKTLRGRSILSESAMQFIIGALRDEDADVRWSAASALSNQSTLSESAIQSLIGALRDENANVRRSAASALGNQSTMSESAIQSLIDGLGDENV